MSIVEGIKVYLTKRKGRKFWLAYYFDPVTGRQVMRSTKATEKAVAVAFAEEWETSLNARQSLESEFSPVGPYSEYSGNIVYFIGMMAGVRVLSVKIGKTKNLESRIRQHQTSSPCPLEILAVLRDPEDRLEVKLHQLFSKHRLEGEWFKPHPDLLRLIDDMNKQCGANMPPFYTN